MKDDLIHEDFSVASSIDATRPAKNLEAYAAAGHVPTHGIIPQSGKKDPLIKLKSVQVEDGSGSPGGNNESQNPGAQWT